MAASSRLRKQLDESGGSGGSKLNESFVAVRERLKAMALLTRQFGTALPSLADTKKVCSRADRGRAELYRTPTSSCRCGSRTCGTRRAGDGFMALSRVRQCDFQV